MSPRHTLGDLKGGPGDLGGAWLAHVTRVDAEGGLYAVSDRLGGPDLEYGPLVALAGSYAAGDTVLVMGSEDGVDDLVVLGRVGATGDGRHTGELAIIPNLPVPADMADTYEICDGDLIDVDDPATAALAAYLGTVHNTGGEPAGFVRVPDYRDRYPVGAGDLHAAGATDGLSAASRAAAHGHSHSHGDGTLASAAHTHGPGTLAHQHAHGIADQAAHDHGAGTLTGLAATNTAIGGTSNRITNPITGNTGTAGLHSHGGATDPVNTALTGGATDPNTPADVSGSTGAAGVGAHPSAGVVFLIKL